MTSLVFNFRKSEKGGGGVKDRQLAMCVSNIEPRRADSADAACFDARKWKSGGLQRSLLSGPQQTE